jgi:hypothetical protein
MIITLYLIQGVLELLKGVLMCYKIGEGDMATSMSSSSQNSAHRRRTDLMPTITFSSVSPGSGLSRSSTPGTRMLRSPGKAVSMSRLDALSKPRTPRLHAPDQQAPAKRPSVPQKHSNASPSPPSKEQKRKMSQSMTHLGPKKLSLPPEKKGT